MASYQITWPVPGGTLVAIEPSSDEVVRYAAQLTRAYNDPHNAPLLGHTEQLTETDVIAHYADTATRGGTNFLVFRGRELIGDADLRHVSHVSGGAAEIALLVAAVAAQGQGLGTRIATMVSAFGFAQLGLDRLYASILPGNAGSRRVFEKLGYALDDSPAGRAYAEEPGDLVYAIDRAAFHRLHASALAELQFAMR